MSKRSHKFQRSARDFYRTPLSAAAPLLPHLPSPFLVTLIEPCAGDGALIGHLQRYGYSFSIKSDIEPQADDINKMDVMSEGYIAGWSELGGTSHPDVTPLIVTNPPWDRNFLHPFIDEILKGHVMAWLLFDADWMHTKQARVYQNHISRIVSVGRVKWIEDSKSVGFDNVCWYLFDPKPAENGQFTEFCMK